MDNRQSAMGWVFAVERGVSVAVDRFLKGPCVEDSSLVPEFPFGDVNVQEDSRLTADGICQLYVRVESVQLLKHVERSRVCAVPDHESIINESSVQSGVLCIAEKYESCQNEDEHVGNLSSTRDACREAYVLMPSTVVEVAVVVVQNDTQ